VGVAEAERYGALGSFDLALRAEGGSAPLGTWSKTGGELGLEQSLPVFGRPRFGVSYRYGADFPDWDGGRMTSEGGELRAAVAADLGRDLLIDKERAAIERTAAGLDGARADLALAELALAEAAVPAYWAWVAAGHVLAIERSLLRAAEERQGALAAQVQRGALAPIVLDDNRRLVLSRQAGVVDAQRVFDVAARKLGYYFRDEAGQMRLPTPDELPSLNSSDVEVPSPLDGATGVERRPELRGLMAIDRQLDVDRRVADNETWPKVTAKLYAAQDLGPEVQIGPETTSNKTEVFAGVGMSLPLQRREARGKAAAVRAKQEVLAQKRRKTRELLLVEVENARIKLEASAQKVALAEGALSAARRLEEAERRRFDQGQSDLLAVNLREQTTASEARKLVEAETTLAEARVLYRLAAGLPPLP
jgi:outer membrane protein TolC